MVVDHDDFIVILCVETMVKICFFLRERINFGLLVCNTKQFSNPNNLFMTGSYASVQWCTENNESSLPYELTAFLTAACHIENICLMAAGKREQRTCSHKVADHRGHLQGLLVVVPVISMLRPVLSCSNYHSGLMTGAVQTAHCWTVILTVME